MDKSHRVAGNYIRSDEKYEVVISDAKLQIIGNKTKGQLSKRVLQETKAHQIFGKTNISYPLIRTRTFAS